MLSRVLICLRDNTWGGCAARLCNYCRLLVTDSRIVHPRIQLVQQTTPSMLENGGQRANGQPFSMRVNGFVEAMDEMGARLFSGGHHYIPISLFHSIHGLNM